jgi:hypothetical protein
MRKRAPAAESTRYKKHSAVDDKKCYPQRQQLMPKVSSFTSAVAIISFLVFSFPSGVLGDLPLVVDDAKPVADGYWRFDWVMALSQPQKGARELDLPILALTYGIFKRLDFGIGIQRIKSDASGDASIQGFQDLHLASKFNLIEEETIPAVSFSLDVKVPTANRQKGLTSGRSDENLLLIATKHYFPLGIDLNLGYSIIGSPPDEKLKNRFFGGLALRYGLSERWRLVGDIFGQSREAKGEKNEANFQLGFRFRPDLPMFFDAAIGRSLLPSGTRIQGTLGMTWSNSLKF